MRLTGNFGNDELVPGTLFTIGYRPPEAGRLAKVLEGRGSRGAQRRLHTSGDAAEDRQRLEAQAGENVRWEVALARRGQGIDPQAPRTRPDPQPAPRR
jgi:hypothetical protein